MDVRFHISTPAPVAYAPDPWSVSLSCITVGAVVGYGGFGSVSYGQLHCPNDSFDAAIKSISYNAETLKKCQREKDIMQYLRENDTPNVVKFYRYAVDEFNSKYYLTMEYAPYTLREHIKKLNPFVWKNRYKIIQEMVNGVAWMHYRGVVHGDLKPANVLLDAAYHVKICDFGSSAMADCARNRSGTAGFKAPEIVLKQSYNTVKSDIFSLGMTMWSMVALGTPFGRFLFDERNKFIAEGVRETIPQGIPPKLAHLIRWCWHQDPDKRPTANEVLEELQTDIDVISPRLASR